MAISRRPPPSQFQRDSHLRSSNFIAEQYQHPREGLRQLHSLASYSSVSAIGGPRFYNGHRRMFSSEGVHKGGVPTTHSLGQGSLIEPRSESGAQAGRPELLCQKSWTNWHLIMMVFTVISLVVSLGMLLRVLYTSDSVFEEFLDGLGFVTTGTQSSRIQELEEAVRKITSRLDITAQSLTLFTKESQIRELEAAVQQLSTHLDSTTATALSLMNSCSERQVRRTHLRLIKELAGEQDFSLSTAGAKVVSQLTTTPSHSPLTWLHSSRTLYTPDNVLGGSIRAGDCWDMLAPAGQLGISLPRPVVISHVTIDHIPQDLVFDIEKAPKHAVLWGLVDGKSNRKKVEGLEITHPTEFQQLLSTRQGPQATAGYNYVPLAYITYDITVEEWVQSFTIIQEIAQLQMDFGVVVLEVLDNWGGTSTCLYRVRIHGK